MARKKLLTLKASEDEMTRWHALAEAQNKPLSKIIREYLDRLCVKAAK